jgi:hypothetical protein
MEQAACQQQSTAALLCILDQQHGMLSLENISAHIGCHHAPAMQNPPNFDGAPIPVPKLKPQGDARVFLGNVGGQEVCWVGFTLSGDMVWAVCLDHPA